MTTSITTRILSPFLCYVLLLSQVTFFYTKRQRVEFSFSKDTSATVTVGTAVIGAAIASAVGVALQLGITAAIDANNGGAAATQAMQSGHMDSTTKQYQALVGNSLLFGGSVNTGSNASIDSATSIQSNNINQTADNKESASYAEEHKDIGPDWNQLMMDAAINGVVSGVTVAAAPAIGSLISSGISKLGLAGVVDSISSVTSKIGSVIDDIMQTTGLKAISNTIDDVTASVSKSVDDLLGTGAKSGSKATGALVSGNKVDTALLPEDGLEIVQQANEKASKILGKDVTKMNNTQKLQELNKLNKIAEKTGTLTKEQKIIRDAMYANYEPSDALKSFNSNLKNELHTKIWQDQKLVNSIDNWESLTANQKKNVLQKISNMQTDLAGTNRVKVVLNKLDLNTYGEYLNGKITIGSNKMDDVTQTLDTITHETQHAIQDYMVDHASKFPKLSQDIKYFKYNNGEMYISPPKEIIKARDVIDNTMYLYNPTEHDAWNVGNDIKNTLFNSN